jgi:hypothetical protein
MERRYTRLAPTADVVVESSNRLVRYTFSDESVGRDRYIVLGEAWQVENFKSNPVFLWQHDDSTPPIGKVIDLVVGRTLRGTVKYAETEFADTIFRLVKDKYLNAVSTSWLPIEAPQRSNQTGADLVFTQVDLLEISQVCIGALPTALAEARSRGLNLRPLRRWAERSLDRHVTVPNLSRGELERVYRAAAGKPETRADRLRRLREFQAKERRRERAREIMESVRRDDAIRRGDGN